MCGTDPRSRHHFLGRYLMGYLGIPLIMTILESRMIWKNLQVNSIRRQEGFVHYGVASGLNISDGERNVKVCPAGDCSHMAVINKPTECMEQRWWRGNCTPLAHSLVLLIFSPTQVLWSELCTSPPQQFIC